MRFGLDSGGRGSGGSALRSSKCVKLSVPVHPYAAGSVLSSVACTVWPDLRARSLKCAEQRVPTSGWEYFAFDIFENMYKPRGNWTPASAINTALA
jgi:hypothetical protein